MKKLTTMFLAAVLSFSVLCLGGCGTTQGQDDELKPEDIVVNLDRNMKATLEIMIPNGNLNEKTMIDYLIDNDLPGVNGEGITFKDLFPNVEVNVNFVSLTNYASSIQQQQLDGTLSDIVWSNSPDFYDLYESKTFVSLEPFIEASNRQAVCNTYLDEEGKAGKFVYADDFFTEYFKMSSVDDKCYVIPRSSDSVVTFLNTDILTKAGVDLNPETTKVKNGWTWTEFLEVCAQVRAYMDTHGMRDDYVFDANLTSWLSVCYPMLLSYGAEVLDENGKVTLESDATRNCLADVADLVAKRYVNDSTVAVNGSYANAHSAMMFNSASVSLYADRKALKGNVDLVTFPLIEENDAPKIGAGVAGYAISAQSKNKDLAWAFLTFMVSRYGQQRMALNGLNLASIRKDLSDHTQANWGKEYKDLNLSAYLWGSEYKQATDFFMRTNLSAKAGIQSALISMFGNALNAKKNNDIDAILSTAVRDINAAMIEY